MNNNARLRWQNEQKNKRRKKKINEIQKSCSCHTQI